MKHAHPTSHAMHQPKMTIDTTAKTPYTPLGKRAAKAVRMPTHHRLSWLVQALLMGGLLGPVQAQTRAPVTPATPAEAAKPALAQDLRSMRERTRQSIEAVRSEQPGALDEARGLGQRLDTPQAQERANLWRERAEQAAMPDPAEPNAIDLTQGANYRQAIQWPEARSVGKRRVLPRPKTAGEDDAPRLEYVPDFSRQQFSLGILAGGPLIDLPQQDVADMPPNTPLARSQLNPAEALGLPDLVNIGMAFSPVMDQALAQLDIAINRSKQARSDLLPRVSMRASEGPERSIGVNVLPSGRNRHTTSSDGVRVSQPLFNMPLFFDWLSELSNEQAAQWRRHAASESVALAVTQATLNLASARMVMLHSDEQLLNFTRLLDYVQSRAQTGAASNADLERTRTRVLFARQTRIEQQANYKSALLEVQRLTGQSPSVLRLPFLNQLPGLPTTHGELRRMVWAQSHDLRALRADIEAQRRALGSNETRLLPVIGVSAEHDAARNSRGTNPRQVDQRIVAVATWDLSLGGKEIYAIKSAAAELNNREAKLTEQGERIMQQVDADFAALQSATLRVTAGQAEQLSSAVVVASVNEQLRIGRIGSLLEALDAYERHFGARQRLTQTLTQQMQSQAQLLARMGVLSELQQTAQAELAPRGTTTPIDVSSPVGVSNSTPLTNSSSMAVSTPIIESPNMAVSTTLVESPNPAVSTPSEPGKPAAPGQ